jgi:uracil-DNA glycosylase
MSVKAVYTKSLVDMYLYVKERYPKIYKTKHFILFYTQDSEWFLLYTTLSAIPEALKIKDLTSITFDSKDLFLLYPDDLEDLISAYSDDRVSIDYHESTTLLDYTFSHTPKGWEKFFNDTDTNGLEVVSQKLSGTNFYPPIYAIYTCFEHIKPPQVKVLLIGQDPYFNKGQAMGISFSVRKGISVPPSLRNIYKELEDDGFSIADSCGDLTSWCRQGVLMLNAALTVEPGRAKSHTNIWMEKFTPSLMVWLSKVCQPMVIIMWGSDAQAFSEFFSDRHKKIKSSHPSPYSANYTFFGSRPFSKANKYLKELGREPIDWSL